ncbi:MAG: phosphoribosylaminoimidazolesuccinocarboxamide synthase [Phycisphaerae bacterium]|nr:phosphoribosylaminoimidazolesuccinocarboxamide synthase [Phycisphaerae bacterium]
MMRQAVLQTSLPFPCRRGKVRDVYDLGDTLLIVATDRISAFDCIMPNGIPDKGMILTALSRFWFEKFSGEFENHLISADVASYPPEVRPFSEQIAGRSMWVKKASVIPIECVARGYLAGSGWLEYRAGGTVCGVALPAGLRQCDRLPTPIFTPASKAEHGHDENITYEQTVNAVGVGVADAIREKTLRLYSKASEYAAARGIILADTKFEFGVLPDGSIILIDEVLTPDSSRFWPADDYSPGRDQPSFDKQFVRNYLNTLSWNKHPPAPPLPDDVVRGTRSRYVEAFEKLSGRKFNAIESLPVA